MIPTAKSVSAPTSQVLNALSDFSFFIFRFRLLIFPSPPYKYIISYRARYVNSMYKKYNRQQEKILLPDCFLHIFFFHIIIITQKAPNKTNTFNFFDVFLYISRASSGIRLPYNHFPSVLQFPSSSFCRYT